MQVRVAGHERAAAGASRPGYGPVVARAAAGYETWGQGDKALINVFSGDRLGIRYLRHRSDGCHGGLSGIRSGIVGRLRVWRKDGKPIGGDFGAERFFE